MALISRRGDDFTMEIAQWDERYRSGDRAKEDQESAPNPLLAATAAKFRPGKVLDLACGAGRNTVWLAEHGWQVTAVDGAPSAIEMLRERTAARGVKVDAQVSSKIANLQNGGYRIEPDSWDLIAICFYLQKSLFEPAKRGLRPGGVLLIIVHISAPGEEPTEHQLRPGELETYFRDLPILHYREGVPDDPAHKRLVAEIVVQRPAR
jgi:SAM-dependent methyltransferase